MNRPFWILITAVLLNQLGTMVGPFMPLYLHRDRGYDEETTSALLAAGSLAAVAAGALGGWCSDQWGRRACLIFGFLTSLACMALLPGAAGLHVVATLVVGRAFAAAFIRPSQSAGISDLVRQVDQRKAFGIFRTAMNLGFGLGTFVGGLLAASGFVDLFIVNSIAAALAAVMSLAVPETRPGYPGSQAAVEPKPPGGLEPVAPAGARVSFELFLVFCCLCLTLSLLSGQMNTTLPLSIERRASARTDVEGLYGLLLALNGGIVCLTQIVVTRLFTGVSTTRALAIGAVLYGAGYGAVGLSIERWSLGLCVATFTVGEMLFFPMASTWVASVAPPDRRGRWFGLLSVSYGLGNVITPLAGTWVLKRHGDAALWALSPFVAAVAAIGFLLLDRGLRKDEA